MKICIAQARPVKGDIPTNIAGHKRLIGLASSMGADAVFFPELSLTGFEPVVAKELSTDQEDGRIMIHDSAFPTGNTLSIDQDIVSPVHDVAFMPMNKTSPYHGVARHYPRVGIHPGIKDNTNWSIDNANWSLDNAKRYGEMEVFFTIC